MTEQTKRCRRCKRELPLTEEHWHRSKKNGDGSGFTKWCRRCHEERPRS